jgi:hypothetical protein
VIEQCDKITGSGKWQDEGLRRPPSQPAQHVGLSRETGAAAHQPPRPRPPHKASPRPDGEGAPKIPAVSAEYVAAIPLREECRRAWLPADQDEWQAHRIDDGPEEKLVYCPECAEREFRASERMRGQR